MRFQLNDSTVYFEIKEEYIAMRKALSVAETLKALHRDYSDYFEDEEDKLFALLAIAQCQIRRHELTKDVIEQISEIRDKLYTLSIMTSKALNLFYEKVKDPKYAIDYQQSIIIPNQVKQQGFADKWQIGDVYAYRLLGSQTENEDRSSQFCLLRKVDQLKQPGQGVSWPIVYLTLWQQHSFPQNEDQLLNAGFLITNMHRSLRRKDKEDYRVALIFEKKTMG